MWRTIKDLEQKVHSVGRARGGGRSSKAKGRSACVDFAAMLRARFNLGAADVFVKATSQGGVDLHLSPHAQQYFPFSIELKNSETLAIWAALRQAHENATPEYPAVLAFKRAHTKFYVACDADTFLRVVHESRGCAAGDPQGSDGLTELERRLDGPDDGVPRD